MKERLGVGLDLGSKNKFPEEGMYRFLITYSRMVPEAVDRGFLTGITGYDWFEEYRLGGRGGDLEIVEELPFGRAKVVAFRDYREPSAPFLGPARVVTPYPNIAAKYFRNEGLGIKEVPGETEGWVKAGLSEYGVDNKDSGETLERTGLEICDEILDTNAIIISRRENKNKVRDVWGLK